MKSPRLQNLTIFRMGVLNSYNSLENKRDFYVKVSAVPLKRGRPKVIKVNPPENETL